MGAKYKIGDLIVLNDFGRLVIDDNEDNICLVITNAIDKVYSLDFIPEEEEVHYWSYDLMVGDKLLRDVPEEFIDGLYTEKDVETL